MAKVHVGSVAAGILALVLGVSACGGADRDDPAAARGTLVIALPSQPENLNPIGSDNVYEGNQKFFNGLLRYAKDLTPEPDLAARCRRAAPTAGRSP